MTYLNCLPDGSLVGRTFFVLQFCRASKNGHAFGLVIDGDEFCVKLGDSGGRINLGTVLAD